MEPQVSDELIMWQLFQYSRCSKKVNFKYISELRILLFIIITFSFCKKQLNSAKATKSSWVFDIKQIFFTP